MRHRTKHRERDNTKKTTSRPDPKTKRDGTQQKANTHPEEESPDNQPIRHNQQKGEEQPNKRPSISASSASSAVIFDKNDILVVTTVSDADIEALKADRLFNKYVWYCLMFLFTLGFLGSVFCALGFAYVKYYQDYIKEVAAGVTSGGGGDYINHGDLGPHSSHPVT